MQEKTVNFTLRDGTSLHTRQWAPDEPPQATLVLIHGYSDHGARYRWVASELTRAGIAVAAPDLRGHGESPGKRAYIASFEALVADVDEYVESVREQFHKLPLFVMGHSMGGLLVASYALRHPRVNGIILSSPLLKVSNDIPPFLQRIAAIVGTLFPWLPVLPMETGAISRDPEAVRECAADPLGYHGRIAARSGAEMLRATNRIQNHMEDLDLPLLLLHGTDDRLCDVKGSKQLYMRARSMDKTLRLFEGGYHELFNDFDKNAFIEEVAAWVNTRAVTAGDIERLYTRL